jgi:hypothetical protein
MLSVAIGSSFVSITLAHLTSTKSPLKISTIFCFMMVYSQIHKVRTNDLVFDLTPSGKVDVSQAPKYPVPCHHSDIDYKPRFSGNFGFGSIVNDSQS